MSDIPGTVFVKFEELSLRVWRQGFKRYSADAILHQVRWHYNIERGERDFTCNNNWTPTLARWFLRHHPECGAFFSLRALSPADQFERAGT